MALQVLPPQAVRWPSSVHVLLWMEGCVVNGECATCSEGGRKGYCALGRCYCGHPSCHGYASWSPLPEPVLESAPAKKPARKSSWDTREESTWIDSL